MKRVASPGSMHDTGCLGLVQWDDPEGWYGEGGGRRVQDGEHMYTCGGFSPVFLPGESSPMDRGAWRAMVHRVAESDMTEATSCVCKQTNKKKP